MAFMRGKSGNSAGRPVGTRHKALVALDAIGTENAGAILEAVVTAAKGGDMRAAEILLSRLWPVRKGRPVELAFPPLHHAADLVVALAAVAEAMARGEVSPDEAHLIAGVLEVQRRSIETADLEQRLVALEQAGRP